MLDAAQAWGNPQIWFSIRQVAGTFPRESRPTVEAEPYLAFWDEAVQGGSDLGGGGFTLMTMSAVEQPAARQ